MFGNLVFTGSLEFARGSNMSDRLLKGQKLNRGEFLTSSNGRYSLAMQEDGNLVLYITGTIVPVWSSRTCGERVAWLAMQEDGNLVIYKTDGTPIWKTDSSASDVAWFVVQDDGNLCCYRANGAVLWASNTRLPDEFFEETKVEIPQAVINRAQLMRDPDALSIIGALVCTTTPQGVAVCVGTMILIAILLEVNFGDPPFGPNNDIRVVGGRVSDEAKRAGKNISDYAKDLGGSISSVWQRWF